MDIPSTPNTSSLSPVSTKDAEGSKDTTNMAGAKCRVVELDHCYSILSQQSTDTLTTMEEQPVLERVATSYVPPDPEPPAEEKLWVFPQTFPLTGNSLTDCSPRTVGRLDQPVQVACDVRVKTEYLSWNPGPSSSAAASRRKVKVKSAEAVEKRREKNMLTARNSRAKKNALLKSLNERADDLVNENYYLKRQNIEMKRNISDKEEENQMLRELLSNEECEFAAEIFKPDSNEACDPKDESECVKNIQPKKEYESVPDYFDLDPNQKLFETDDDAS
ncbi:hypothetical protein [Endozoicomonas sp. 4G]|uniref:hypothetical protein n=1 Tax=Endozoicomonas sp. 4G TaxID=2872754 RepID=UPI002078EBA0|nr:hypothetical protein [Endozoicomonas sp. 4G]